MIIFVGVEGVLIYSLVKFRARKGAVAAQIHGNTRLEIGWTVGAALILVFLAVVTFATLPGIRNPPNSDAAAAEHGRDRAAASPSRAARSCRRTASRWHRRQRPAVHLALHVRRTATTTTLNNAFSYERDGRARRRRR